MTWLTGVRSNCDIFYQPYVSFVGMILFLAIAIYNPHKTTKTLLGCSLVLIGGLSNLIERLMTGCVLDYINFFGLFRFNFFDLSVTLGVVLVLYDLWLRSK